MDYIGGFMTKDEQIEDLNEKYEELVRRCSLILAINSSKSVGEEMGVNLKLAIIRMGHTLEALNG